MTFRSMIAQLPRPEIAKSPWLTLWLGSALVLVDPLKARRTLKQVFDSLEAAQDERGCLLAAAGIVETHNIEQTEMGELDRWIAVLARGLAPDIRYSSPAERLRVHTAFAIAAMLRQPAHRALPQCLREVDEFLELDIAAAAKADTATQLLEFFCFTGDLRRALALVTRVGSLFEQEELPPFRRAGWLVFYSYYAALAAAYAPGFQAGCCSTRASAGRMPWHSSTPMKAPRTGWDCPDRIFQTPNSSS